MTTLKFEKRLNNLPGTLAADTMYMVKKGSNIEMYVSDSTGTVASPVVAPNSSGIHPFLLLGANND